MSDIELREQIDKVVAQAEQNARLQTLIDCARLCESRGQLDLAEAILMMQAGRGRTP